MLRVEPVADSYLVRIALGGSEPEGLDTIVNAVAKAYLSRTAKRELDGTDVGLQLLTSRQSELQQNIAKRSRSTCQTDPGIGCLERLERRW